MRAIFITSIVILLSSCSAEHKANKFFDRHPDKLAELCSNEFPVVTKFLLGKEKHFRDTTMIKGDSIPCKDKQGVLIQYIKCPDVPCVRDSVRITDTLKVEDTAKIKVLENKLAKSDKKLIEANTEIDRYKKLTKTLYKWLAGSVGLVLIGAAFSLRKLTA